MIKRMHRITLAAVVLCIFLSTPLPVFAAGMDSTSSDPSPDPSDATSESMPKGYALMMKGADMLLGMNFRKVTVGADTVVEKKKRKMLEGQRMILAGHAMMTSAGKDDEASRRMMKGADMMVEGADMMLKTPIMMDIMMDGKKMVLDGKRMMIKAKKRM